MGCTWDVQQVVKIGQGSSQLLASGCYTCTAQGSEADGIRLKYPVIAHLMMTKDP